MANTKQNLNLKIQMLAGKNAKTFFERFFKYLPSLVIYVMQKRTVLRNDIPFWIIYITSYILIYFNSPSSVESTE